MKKSLIIVFGAIILLGTGLSLLFLSNERDVASQIEPATYAAQEDLSFWIKEIQKKGADSSYKKFIDSNKSAPLGVQHIRAHVMGEALFSTEEINGIAICDSNFGFGCFHGLFTVGFASRGRSFIKEADTTCVARYGVFGTGCQHGIGHGIVEYTGPDRLNEALSLCKETSQPTPLLGCTSGVFMEHNTPFTVLPGEALPEPYPFSEEHPYGACNEVDSEYQESCYYELGGWWEVVLKGDKLKMGELCSEIADTQLRDMCALGLGNIIGPTNEYSVEKSSALCSSIPENVQTLCHAGAAWSMFSNPNFSDRAKDMCENLSSMEKEICLESYDLATPLP
ncbi:MAG: hypothetical protein JKX80_02940 [Candidatus Pacebacteria bacterium]|nr:hypothetical protein [Candidatus Paceibacterota bacterium]